MLLCLILSYLNECDNKMKNGDSLEFYLTDAIFKYTYSMQLLFGKKNQEEMLLKICII